MFATAKHEPVLPNPVKTGIPGGRQKGFTTLFPQFNFEEISEFMLQKMDIIV